METITLSKSCIQCHLPLQGRSDKKFCDDHCRNAFNNTNNSLQNNYIRKVTHILLKNRRILAEFLADDAKMNRVSAESLRKKGFQTSYYTNTIQNKSGQVYYFNFEYGYLMIDSLYFLIVRKKALDLTV